MIEWTFGPRMGQLREARLKHKTVPCNRWLLNSFQFNSSKLKVVPGPA